MPHPHLLESLFHKRSSNHPLLSPSRSSSSRVSSTHADGFRPLTLYQSVSQSGSQSQQHNHNHHKRKRIAKKMHDMPSRFVEIFDPSISNLHRSDSDIKLEDILADHEAIAQPQSAPKSSGRPDRGNLSSAAQRWKRLSLSNILNTTRRQST